MTNPRDALFDGIGYALLILTPFVVGFFVAVGAEQGLGAMFPFNIIIAVVMELAGIMSMHLISRTMDWNATHAKRAPMGWAIIGALAYMGIALGIIVLLDWPASRTTAVKGSFVALGLVVYMLFALYRQQVKREQGEQARTEIEHQDERWKYELDKQYNLERYRIRKETETNTLPVRQETAPNGMETEQAILTYYGEHPTASMRQVAQYAKCAPSTVNKRVRQLEAAGRIKRNGNGVEVL